LGATKEQRRLACDNLGVGSEELAINGGPRVRDRPYPRWPALGEEDVEAVLAVIQSGQLTQLTGRTVEAFEEAFAGWHGADHCIATSSGTTAIHSLLAALGVGPGDEVIVPAHTFIASASPVLHQRATPVFADVDPHTFCISPESVAERISPRTKAIIAVHLNGHPADMDALLALAEPKGVALVEDAAQAHGATYKGRKVGTIGRAGCFSFWEDKIITTGGEGGCVVTNDDDLAERMQRIRHHGETPVEGGRTYYHPQLGYNYRMSSLHAATGLVQLGNLERYLWARRRNAELLTERLAEYSSIEPPLVAQESVHSYYKYICRLRPEAGIGIDWFVGAVAAEGIPISRRYSIPLPHQPVFRDSGFGKQPCPIAERLAGELFTLLVHPTLSEDDVSDAASAIGKVAGQLKPSSPVRSREDAPEAIARILDRLSRTTLINKEDVQNRLVEFCLAALGWRLDSTNTQVWLPVSGQMAKLWGLPSAQTKRDYALSFGDAQVLHIEVKHKWRRFAVDLDTFLDRINRGDWDDTRREGPNRELGVLLWAAQEAKARRAVLIDEKRLLVFERAEDWRLAREVDLFVEPIERVRAAFMLLAPP
jgi:perosamine synthetase